MKRTLYVGLELPKALQEEAIHCPVIRLQPYSPLDVSIQNAFSNLLRYTHLLFTSKNGVKYFLENLLFFGYSRGVLSNKMIGVVGKKTAERATKEGLRVDFIAEEETAEGLIAALKRQKLGESFIFWPRSANARATLTEFFRWQGISYCDCALYRPVPYRPDPLPSLKEIDKIIFTSPSTVEGFRDAFGELPRDKILEPIGPVTAQKLSQLLAQSNSV